MVAVPSPSHTTANAIYALHTKKNVPRNRKYVGAGIAGHACTRYLWLALRNAVFSKIEPRILRLFETGHKEEARVLAELAQLDDIELFTADPQDATRQIGCTFSNGHGRGFLDAIVRGLPEAPKTWHVLDVKTISSKKLKELIKLKGKLPDPEALEKFSPNYYTQGMIYMGEMSLTRAMFVFVCKDSDQIIVMRYPFNLVKYNQALARVTDAALIEVPPPPISFEADHFTCQWCEMKPICHGTQAARPHCRTCAHVTPVNGGGWYCEHFKREIKFEHQHLDGSCPQHRYNPSLLNNFAELIQAIPNSEGNTDVEYESRMHGPDAKVVFINGAPPSGYTSLEIYNCLNKSLLGDDQTPVGIDIQEWRKDGAVLSDATTTTGVIPSELNTFNAGPGDPDANRRPRKITQDGAIDTGTEHPHARSTYDDQSSADVGR